MTVEDAVRTADIESPEDRCAKVLAKFADEVDRDARFPHEALDALKADRLLSIAIPEEFGGQGADIATVSKICRVLGRACASTAMIFAMHQVQVFCILRHGDSDYARALLRKAADEQLLFASATTEIGIGGNVGASTCAVVDHETYVTLTKNAPVISYGEFADAILVTARRNEDSPPNDQVLLVCEREGLDLERTSEWNTMGFRGTCSPGFMINAKCPPEAVLDGRYADISAETMLPVSHTLWASVWLGLSDAAATKARKYVQKAARATPDTPPPSALRLAELTVAHRQFADTVHGAIRTFEDNDLSSVGMSLAMNNVKVIASNAVVDLVSRSLLICGIAGYREDTPFSMSRLLRDAYGAALMISNDRILTNNAKHVLVYRENA